MSWMRNIFVNSPSGVGISPGMVEWWHGWIGGGSRTARSKSRTRVRGQQSQDPGCGVTEVCYCEKTCVCACFVVTGIFYIHISEIGVLVEFEVKSEFERLRSLQGNATFSFYNNS